MRDHDQTRSTDHSLVEKLADEGWDHRVLLLSEHQRRFPASRLGQSAAPRKGDEGVDILQITGGDGSRRSS